MEDARPPGNLAIVADFVNTKVYQDDTIATPEALCQWLIARNHIAVGDHLDDAALKAALVVREGVRQLLLANNGALIDSARLDALNILAAGLPMILRFETGAPASLQPQLRGVDGFLAAVLSFVRDAMLDGSWTRMKACRNDGCQWAFYDRSRNYSRAWCEMAVCGNQSKVRAYQRRRREEHAAHSDT